MAGSTYWGFLFVDVLVIEALRLYDLGSVLGPLIFGNSQMGSGSFGTASFGRSLDHSSQSRGLEVFPATACVAIKPAL